MKPPIPHETRRAVLARAGATIDGQIGLCEDCHARRTLYLHHRHYRTVGNETPVDLLALCRKCHHARHLDDTGHFWRDPEELAAHWFNVSGETRRGPLRHVAVLLREAGLK